MTAQEKMDRSGELDPNVPPASGGANRGRSVAAGGEMTVTSVTYRLAANDIRAARRAMLAGNLLPTQMGRAIFCLGIMAIAALVASSCQKSDPPPDRLTGTNLFLLAVGVSIPIIFWLFRRGKGAESPHEVTAKIEPEGLRLREGDLYDSRSAWARFAEIREAPTQILFVIRSFDPTRGKEVTTSGYPIPKRAFDSPEAAASFLETARRWHAEAVAPNEEAYR